MEYKIQAVKLAKEISGAKAAAELGIPENTMYAWTKAAREGRLDIGSGSHQYTSKTYRRAVAKHSIFQSMNSDGGRCHDNVRCESIWARMKEELIYGRHNTERMVVKELKTLIWRYFISYWNNRRICSANEGLPPMVKRQRYYESLDATA